VSTNAQVRVRTECFCPNLSDHDVNVRKFVVISCHYKTTLLVWKTYEYRLLFNSQGVSHKQYNLYYFEWFLISCSSLITWVRHEHLEFTETDGRHTVLSDTVTDLSLIFGSQLPGLPQNHDVVKARRHKRYKNFRRANNMTQLSLVTTCGQKLAFPCFRRVLILCMLCTDYYNNFTTYSYLFFSDTIMPVFVPSLVV
jgi:hypothetical protein